MKRITDNKCVGCGLTDLEEPSVGPRSDALSRCNDCDARRARKQARLEQEVKVAYERIDSLVASVGK